MNSFPSLQNVPYSEKCAIKSSLFYNLFIRKTEKLQASGEEIGIWIQC